MLNKYERIKIFALIGLSSTWPFFTFISNNVTDTLDYGAVFYIWLVCFLTLTFAGWLVTHLPISVDLKRRLIHIGLIFFLSLFLFGVVVDIFQSNFGIDRLRWSILTWAIFTCVLSILTWRYSRQSASSMHIMFIISALCLTAGLNIVYKLYEPSWRGRNVVSDRTISISGEKIVSKINVYYFVLDGYGRADALHEGLNFDNAPFTQNLNKMGFWLGHKSFANYPNTSLSVSSILDMDYLVEPGPNALKNYTQYQILLSGHNRTVNTFKSLGYKFVMVPPGSWAGTDCRGTENICLRTEAIGINETQITLLAMTPFEPILRKIAPSFLKFKRNEFPNMIESIRKTQASSRKPLFVFSHLMIPHDPIYTRDCQVKSEIKIIAESISEEKKRNYVETVECVNRQILEHLPKLISDDPSAIVILQSDHGFSFGDFFNRHPNDWNIEEIKWRYGNFNAIRAPAKCSKYLYQHMSAVNTFRFVFGCLKNMSPNFLADRLFLTRYNFNEVIVSDILP